MHLKRLSILLEKALFHDCLLSLLSRPHAAFLIVIALKVGRRLQDY